MPFLGIIESMKILLVLVFNSLLLLGSLQAQDALDRSKRAQRRSLPTIDKKKLSLIKSRLKRRKIKKLKTERRAISKNVAKTDKLNKKRSRRKRRLALLRAARNRLNNNLAD